MKVLIATPLYPPESGGPATYSKLLEDGLPTLGVEVALVPFRDVRHLPKLLRHIAYFFRVLKAARSADIIYTLDAVSVGFPATCAAKLARKPLLVKIVGDYAWEQGRQRFGVTKDLDEFVKERDISLHLKLFRWIQTTVVNAAKEVVVPSAYLKDVVVAWGIPAEKITVIHNAISLETMTDASKEVIALPKPLIVSVGRLVPWKGFNEVIEAVATIRANGIPASLAIIGDGPERDVLKERAERILQTDFVFTGALSHAQTLAVMKCADVFVLDSTYEGLSHVLIEAVMLGLPIIASDIGGNREVITNGENGLLVAAGDSSALAGAFGRILKDDQLRARLSARALESAADFSLDAMLQKTIAVLPAISAR